MYEILVFMIGSLILSILIMSKVLYTRKKTIEQLYKLLGCLNKAIKINQISFNDLNRYFEMFIAEHESTGKVVLAKEIWEQIRKKKVINNIKLIKDIPEKLDNSLEILSKTYNFEEIQNE